MMVKIIKHKGQYAIKIPDEEVIKHGISIGDPISVKVKRSTLKGEPHIIIQLLK